MKGENRAIRCLVVVIVTAGCFCWASLLKGQCNDGDATVNYVSYVAPISGAQVFAYAETWFTGNWGSVWQPFADVDLTVPSGTKFTAPEGSANPGLHASTSVTKSAVTYGYGIYHQHSFHKGWNTYCHYWNPPYLGGWDGNSYDSFNAQQPTISGWTHAIWWLGPNIFALNGYYAQLALSADRKGFVDNPQWSITMGSGKITGWCTSQDCTQSLWTALARSSGCDVQDVKIRISVGGLLSEEYGLFINTPWKLTGQSAFPYDDGDGWETDISWAIRDICSYQLSDLVANEMFDYPTQSDYAGENWDDPDEVPWPSLPTPIWTDYLYKINWCQGHPGCTPPAINFSIGGYGMCGVATYKVDNWGQTIFLGSTSTGDGVRVMWNRHQEYQDCGQHEYVTTPLP